MSLPASHAHDFVSASPSALSDTEPPDEWKRQIKERINTNLQKLYQDADDLYRRRLQDARSDDERARLKEDRGLEVGRIRTLGAEEYHTQLELERQQRRWAMGQPIDAKWKDALEREHRKIFESYKPVGPSSDALRPNGTQSGRSDGSATEERTIPLQRSTITVPEYHPPPLPPEIEQRKASQSREERPPPPRVRRESDAVSGSAKEEYRHAAYFPNPEERYNELWTRNLTEEPESSMYHHPNKSRPSVERSSVLDRSEEDRPSTRASERLTRTGTERYAPSPKHEIWRPNANTEDEPNGSRRSLARRGSSASQRSIGSNSLRSLTAEPILERPDGNENGGMARKGEGEKVEFSSSLSEKGKERQNQSRTFQIATEQGESRWDELPGPASMMGNLKPPNSAPPPSRMSSSSSERPPSSYPYPLPQRSPSVKVPLHEDDRGFPPPPVYKSPRRHGSKSSFTTEITDIRNVGLTSSSILDEPIHEHNYPYRSPSIVQGSHRPIVPKPSFSNNNYNNNDNNNNNNNNNNMDRDDDGTGGGRYGPSEWYSAPRSRSRLGSMSGGGRDRDFSPYSQMDDWGGSLRQRDRHFIYHNTFSDDSYVNYRRPSRSPERTRPSLARGLSFTSNRSVDDYDIGVGGGGGYNEAYQRRSPSTSIPINRGKQPRSSADDYTIPSWHDWTKHPEGRPPRPSPDSRTSYQVYSPPSSFNAEPRSSSFPTRPHNFGGRETNDHRRNDHVPDSEVEQMRQRLEELREEAAKIEEAEKVAKEKMEEARRKEEEAKRKQDEAKKLEDEAKRKREEARKLEEELKRKEEETNRKEEEVRLKEEETRRKEEEIRLKEEEARLKEEEARLKHEEARLKEEEVRLKEEEARLKDEEATRKEEETRRKEDEIKKKEMDARRKEREVHKKEQEAKRKELEAKRLEEEARRRDEEARRREEETERREEEIERREEDMRKREEELKKREEELLRREEEGRFMEEEAERERQEEARRHEEAARRREEAKREEAARQDEERRHRVEEDKRRREGEKRRRDDERQQRLEAEMKMIGEERRRLEEERVRREEERHRIEEERRRRDEEEAARRQEDENRRKEQETATKRQQEEERRRKQEEEWRKEQERMHEEMMRREWEKRSVQNNAHSAQQGAYDKQREEIQKRKGEERKYYPSSDTGFTSSSPTGNASPISPGRSPNAPQRQGSMNASAWSSASGSAWKAASSSATSATSPSSSTSSSARNSTSSSTSATTASATSASSHTPTPTPTPTPIPASKPKAAPPNTASSPSSAPPLSESEWARRQAEQAKEQQERFRREQEKLENRRIANEINKTITEKDLVQLYQMHDARWKDLNTFEVLRWDTFPWPLVRRPKSAEDIKELAIQAYLFSKIYPEKDYKSDKDRVKEHIKRWHPDKFNTKYLPKVIEQDKERVREGAGAVVRGLNAILTRMNEPQHPGLFG